MEPVHPTRVSSIEQPLIDARVPFWYRVPLLILGAVLDGMAVLGAWYLITEARREDVVPGFLVVAILLVFGWLTWRMGTARLTVVGDTFRIRNIFGSQTVALSDVERFEIGSNAWGISLIPRSSNRTIPVNAIQKSNWAVWMNRRTRADRLAAELNRLVHASRPGDTENDLPPVPPLH